MTLYYQKLYAESKRVVNAKLKKQPRTKGNILHALLLNLLNTQPMSDGAAQLMQDVAHGKYNKQMHKLLKSYTPIAVNGAQILVKRGKPVSDMDIIVFYTFIAALKYLMSIRNTNERSDLVMPRVYNNYVGIYLMITDEEKHEIPVPFEEADLTVLRGIFGAAETFLNQLK